MTLRSHCTSAAFVMAAALVLAPAGAQTRGPSPQSPYGGDTVAEVIARINDQIITNADYERAMAELDQEARQRGDSMQQMSEAHKDLLRNLIDQQLWLSKGKELGITGETDLVNRLNEIRKQYNLATLEDLEKAAHDQGVSFEDFKANIRNGIITQEVMREEVGRRINMTPGEAQRYFDQHQQEFARQESVQLSEILIGANDDQAKIDAAQARAGEVEAKLKAGGDFSQLARTYSEGQTAQEGGDLGQFKRGALAKVLEDQVFPLKKGEYTQPIRTRQGFVILKVVDHIPGGVPKYADVQQEVEQSYYMSKMEPAIRDYLTRMRDDAYLEIKPGYVDTGASPNKQVFPIAYSAYTPPQPKKKKKVERVRYREAGHFRQKAQTVSLDTTKQVKTAAPQQPAGDTAAAKKGPSQKPGKKEKIRFGKAPQETLPNSPAAVTEDAGAVPRNTVASADEPQNPLEPAAPAKKSRFSDRLRQPRQVKAKAEAKQQQEKRAMTPDSPEAGEVADRQTQSSPLGMNGDTSKKKKKKEPAATAAGEKTRYSERAKQPAAQGPEPVPTPIPAVPGAPAPAHQQAPPADQHQAPAPPATQPQGSQAPQQQP